MKKRSNEKEKKGSTGGFSIAARRMKIQFINLKSFRFAEIFGEKNMKSSNNRENNIENHFKLNLEEVSTKNTFVIYLGCSITYICQGVLSSAACLFHFFLARFSLRWCKYEQPPESIWCLQINLEVELTGHKYRRFQIRSQEKSAKVCVSDN